MINSIKPKDRQKIKVCFNDQRAANKINGNIQNPIFPPWGQKAIDTALVNKRIITVNAIIKAASTIYLIEKFVNLK